MGLDNAEKTLAKKKRNLGNTARAAAFGAALLGNTASASDVTSKPNETAVPAGIEQTSVSGSLRPSEKMRGPIREVIRTSREGSVPVPRPRPREWWEGMRRSENVEDSRFYGQKDEERVALAKMSEIASRETEEHASGKSWAEIFSTIRSWFSSR
jgi:hypothetical protein